MNPGKLFIWGWKPQEIDHFWSFKILQGPLGLWAHLKLYGFEPHFGWNLAKFSSGAEKPKNQKTEKLNFQWGPRAQSALQNFKWSKMVNFLSFSAPDENFTSFHPWFLDFVHVFRPFWTLQGVKLSFFTLKWGSNPYIFNWAQRPKVPCKTLSDKKCQFFEFFGPRWKFYRFSPMVFRLCACF